MLVNVGEYTSPTECQLTKLRGIFHHSSARNPCAERQSFALFHMHLDRRQPTSLRTAR